MHDDTSINATVRQSTQAFSARILGGALDTHWVRYAADAVAKAGDSRLATLVSVQTSNSEYGLSSRRVYM